MANVKVYNKSKTGNVNLSNNFKVREFACKDGSNTVKIDYELVCILQKIRDIGGAVTINSAYRTAAHNKKCGGASNSYHLYGRAGDIKCKGLSIDNICKVANSLGVKGIIRYGTFVHIDTRESKYHANNSGKRLTYGKYTIPYSGIALKNGSEGTNVGIVQFKLAKMGYSTIGIVDGKAGSKFTSTVKAFQKANGLVVDGIVGKNTWNKLFN